MALTSRLWRYYERGADRVANCLLCNGKYSYKTSITNLKKHLKVKHENVYMDLMTEMNLSLSDPEMTAVKVEFENDHVSDAEHWDGGSNSEEEPVAKNLKIEPVTNVPTQPVRFKNNGPRISVRKLEQESSVSPTIDENQRKLIDEQLLKMITQDYQPFSIVEEKGFKEFVAALNPNYVLPDRKLISGSLIPGQFWDCKSKIYDLVQQAQKVCLTTECWSALGMDTYLAVTAHFLVDFQLKSVMLHCEQFKDVLTVDALTAALQTVVSEWNITNKITLVISENAPTIKAIENIGWPFFGCFLRKLNLIVEDALEVIEHILVKVKEVVMYFKKNSQATELLVEYQIEVEKKTEAMRLIQSDPMRWNTVFYMLERFSKLKAAIHNVTRNTQADIPVITIEMWVAIRQVSLILKPFEEITRMSHSYLSGSLAIIIVDGLKNAVAVVKSKGINGVSADFLAKLESGIKKHFPDREIKDNMLLSVCTFLDPRFKTHAFIDDAGENPLDALSDRAFQATRVYKTKEYIMKLIKAKIFDERRNSSLDASIVASTSNIAPKEDVDNLSVWGKLDKSIAAATPADDVTSKAKSELESFLKEDVLPRQSCPLSWWKSHACVYPHLAEIFVKYGHTVVTSAECNRVFTKEGDLIMKKRARLSRKRTAELVFLNCNEGYC